MLENCKLPVWWQLPPRAGCPAVPPRRRSRETSPSFSLESRRAAERARNQKPKPPKKVVKPGEFRKPHAVVYGVHKTKLLQPLD